MIENTRLVTWHERGDEKPEGLLLVEVDQRVGSDVAIVTIDDDGYTLSEAEYGDVWTSWAWPDVSRYALMSEILLDREDA